MIDERKPEYVRDIQQNFVLGVVDGRSGDVTLYSADGLDFPCS